MGVRIRGRGALIASSIVDSSQPLRVIHSTRQCPQQCRLHSQLPLPRPLLLPLSTRSRVIPIQFRRPVSSRAAFKYALNLALDWDSSARQRLLATAGRILLPRVSRDAIYDNIADNCYCYALMGMVLPWYCPLIEPPLLVQVGSNVPFKTLAHTTNPRVQHSHSLCMNHQTGGRILISIEPAFPGMRF